jgi:hypothetical protein
MRGESSGDWGYMEPARCIHYHSVQFRDAVGCIAIAIATERETAEVLVREKDRLPGF